MSYFYFSGLKGDKYSFKYCYEKAVNFLSDIIDQTRELWRREVYALSYYYERAVDLGLIGKFLAIIRCLLIIAVLKVAHCSY